MKWNQRTIREWQEKTFGVSEGQPSPRRMYERIRKEFWELNDAVYETKPEKMAEEAADVAILLFGFAAVVGFDLLAEVQKKMDINEKRKWLPSVNGISRHIEE